MKIVVMIDSFKGSLSSVEAGNIIRDEIIKLNPDYDIEIVPVADGGEGTIDALSSLDGAELITTGITGPLGENLDADFLYIKEQNLAVIEMSKAAGLTLIKNKAQPLKATTLGVGMIVNKCLDMGVRDFIIGIGGSATTDAGVGMLSALGYKFLDENSKDIDPSNEGLGKLVRIDDSKVDPRLIEAKFRVACDVHNPLFGENGAAYVYGPQKGASYDEVRIMDKNLRHFHDITKNHIQGADETYKGAGAAGGLGYGLKTYLGADLVAGIELIMDIIGAEELIKNADLIITGEGKLDKQTAMGKVPIGVARLAKVHRKNVIAFAGILDNDALVLNEKGIDAFFPIIDQLRPIDEAMDKIIAEANLRRTVNQTFRLISLYNQN